MTKTRHGFSPNTDGLRAVMARLRDPENGCAWDLEQTFATIAPYTVEEAYEVADAIERGDMEGLRDELGDLLLQVVFHARMAEEAGHFDFNDVARDIVEKMVRRHPNVFGDAKVDSAAAQTEAWEQQKARERAAKAAAGNGGRVSLLDGVTLALPALMRAVKLQARAARAGFDWTNPLDILDKLDEELAELRSALAKEEGQAPNRQVAEELGDLMFTCANLARRRNIDAEAALRSANAKFERRFRHIEARLAERNSSPERASLDDMEELWNEAKRLERS